MREVRACFFIGHREAGENLLPYLTDTVGQLITSCGVTRFYVGGYGNFDRLSGKAVIALKNIFPDIRLFLVIPYHPAERPVATPQGYDGTHYPQGMESVPRKFAIVRANRRIIDECDYLVAFVWHPASNAREFLEYARRREKKGLIHVENLGERKDVLRAVLG